MTEQARQFWNPVPLSQLTQVGEGLDWVWEGVLARRRITLLSAQAKAGKTTLLSLLIRDMAAGGHLFGCRVNPGRVVVVSEESDQDWIIRRDNLSLKDHCEVICLPFLAKPNAEEWLDLLRQGFADVKKRGIELVVFDTLSHLWCVKDENDNGQMQVALMPLRHVSEQGAAVLLMHHAGAKGDRSRGATEVEGFVDQIAHFELSQPENTACRERRFKVRGRLTRSPEKLRVSLTEEGDDYQVLEGNLRPIRSEIWATLVALLPTEPPGETIRELRGGWPEGGEVPSEDTIWQTLKRCGEKSGICRSDAKPFRWWRPTRQIGTLGSPEVSSGYQWN